MTNASAAQLPNLVAQMEDYEVVPNTAQFNLVHKAMYKAMYKAKETVAATKFSS